MPSLISCSAWSIRAFISSRLLGPTSGIPGQLSMSYPKVDTSARIAAPTGSAAISVDCSMSFFSSLIGFCFFISRCKFRNYFSDFQILEQRTQRNACISFAESRQNSPKGQIFPYFFILLPPTQGDKRGDLSDLTFGLLLRTSAIQASLMALGLSSVGRFLPDRALFFLVCCAEKSLKFYKIFIYIC